MATGQRFFKEAFKGSYQLLQQKPGTRRTNVEEQRRTIRVMTGWQARMANSSRVLDSDRLFYEYASACTHIYTLTHTHKKEEKKGREKERGCVKGAL